jgi:hypothetical protein
MENELLKLSIAQRRALYVALVTYAIGVPGAALLESQARAIGDRIIGALGTAKDLVICRFLPGLGGSIPDGRDRASYFQALRIIRAYGDLAAYEAGETTGLDPYDVIEDRVRGLMRPPVVTLRRSKPVTILSNDMAKESMIQARDLMREVAFWTQENKGTHGIQIQLAVATLQADTIIEGFDL